MEDVVCMPFVSIVMPNWNGKYDTLECLDSLRNLDYPKDRLEIIIVDNGSRDNSPQIIREKYSEMNQDGFFSLKLIEQAENIGAPAAINKGIKTANKKFDYIFKLDNDVVIDKDCLRNLVVVANTDNDCGLAGAKVLYYSEPTTIWLTGGKLNLWLMRTKDRNRGKREKAILNEEIESLDDLPGCALLISKKSINQIGLFDENYFVYADDTDYCLRSKRAGFKNLYNPKARVWHKVSQTTNKISGIYIYYMIRNRIILQRKHSTLLRFFIFNLYCWCYEYPRFFISYLMKERHILKSLIRGIWDGYTNMIVKDNKIPLEQ